MPGYIIKEEPHFYCENEHNINSVKIPSLKEPHSLAWIHNQIQKTADFYQNHIESIFEENDLETFHNFKNDRLVHYYLDFCDQLGIAPGDNSSLKRAIRFVKCSPDHENLEGERLQCIKALHLVFQTRLICWRIIHDFDHYFGYFLFKFCISFFGTVISEIAFVSHYESVIKKHKIEIKKELTALADILRPIQDWMKSPITFLENFQSCIKQLYPLRCTINKIYYYVLEWLVLDENYVDEANTLLCTMIDRAETLEKDRDQHTCSANSLKPALSALEKKLINTRKELGKQAHQLKSTTSTIDTLSRMLSRPGIDVEKSKSLKKHLTSAKVELTQIATSFDRVQEEWRRLRQKQSKYNEAYKLACNGLEISSKDLIKTVQVIKDLKLLIGRKKCIDSITAFSSKDFNNSSIPSARKVLEEMCEIVGDRLNLKWPKLYMKLPMRPDRSLERRKEDINKLRRSTQRGISFKELSPVYEARYALGLWRSISHHPQPDDLAQGLQEAGFIKVAQELRSKWPSRFSKLD